MLIRLLPSYFLSVKSLRFPRLINAPIICTVLILRLIGLQFSEPVIRALEPKKYAIEYIS